MSNELPTISVEESILLQTFFLILLRIVYFLISQYFVKISLLTDLNSVIQEDSGNINVTGINNQELEDELELEEAERGYFSTTINNNSNGSNSSSRDNLLGGSPIRNNSLTSNKIKINRRESDLPGLNNNHNNSINLDGTSNFTLLKRQSNNSFYPKVSTILFCLSFSESCMLFTLLLFGEVVNQRARIFNWSLSLFALLSLIVFIIPLGICLLLTHRSQSIPTTRKIILTLIPFSIYLFLFYQVGSLIASHAVTEGSNSFSLINSLLARVCVPGVVLIATLSGGGAVNTAWLAFERRSISSSTSIITDEELLQSERSLARARQDINQRSKALSIAIKAAEEEELNSVKRSILARWTSSKPCQEQVKLLEIELRAMEEVEFEMRRELNEKKKRREIVLLGTTFMGKIWLAAGWGLSFYCVWRVFISCINLIFGYTQGRSNLPSNPDSPDSPSDQQPSTDILTSLITKLAAVLNLDLDIATWSRLIGLILIASIILANMRVVLGSVSRIFKATSTGVSSSFMLLLLAQLMSLYLLTSLISLPSSPTESTTTLLETLPAFNVFSRLFDSVFLLAAGTVFGVRFLQRRVRIALE